MPGWSSFLEQLYFFIFVHTHGYRAAWHLNVRRDSDSTLKFWSVTSSTNYFNMGQSSLQPSMYIINNRSQLQKSRRKFLWMSFWVIAVSHLFKSWPTFKFSQRWDHGQMRWMPYQTLVRILFVSSFFALILRWSCGKDWRGARTEI